MSLSFQERFKDKISVFAEDGSYQSKTESQSSRPATGGQHSQRSSRVATPSAAPSGSFISSLIGGGSTPVPSDIPSTRPILSSRSTNRGNSKFGNYFASEVAPETTAVEDTNDETNFDNGEDHEHEDSINGDDIENSHADTVPFDEDQDMIPTSADYDSNIDDDEMMLVGGEGDGDVDDHVDNQGDGYHSSQGYPPAEDEELFGADVDVDDPMHGSEVLHSADTNQYEADAEVGVEPEDDPDSPYGKCPLPADSDEEHLSPLHSPVRSEPETYATAEAEVEVDREAPLAPASPPVPRHASRAGSRVSRLASPTSPYGYGRSHSHDHGQSPESLAARLISAVEAGNADAHNHQQHHDQHRSAAAESEEECEALQLSDSLQRGDRARSASTDEDEPEEPTRADVADDEGAVLAVSKNDMLALLGIPASTPAAPLPAPTPVPASSAVPKPRSHTPVQASPTPAPAPRRKRPSPAPVAAPAAPASYASRFHRQDAYVAPRGPALRVEARIVKAHQDRTSPRRQVTSSGPAEAEEDRKRHMLLGAPIGVVSASTSPSATEAAPAAESDLLDLLQPEQHHHQPSPAHSTVPTPVPAYVHDSTPVPAYRPPSAARDASVPDFVAAYLAAGSPVPTPIPYAHPAPQNRAPTPLAHPEPAPAPVPHRAFKPKSLSQWRNTPSIAPPPSLGPDLEAQAVVEAKAKRDKMRALAQRVGSENKTRLQRARQRDTVPVVAVQRAGSSSGYSSNHTQEQGLKNGQNKMSLAIGGLVFDSPPSGGVVVSKPTPRAASQQHQQPQTPHETTPPIVTPQTVHAHPAVARAKWGPVVPPRGAGSATVPGSYAREAKKPVVAGRRAERQHQKTGIPKPVAVKPVNSMTPELEEELRAHEESKKMIADMKRNMRL